MLWHCTADAPVYLMVMSKNGNTEANRVWEVR
jgi:hypothetical protein